MSATRELFDAFTRRRFICDYVSSLHAIGALEAKFFAQAVEVLALDAKAVPKESRPAIFRAYQHIREAAKTDPTSHRALAGVSQQGAALVSVCAASWFDADGARIASVMEALHEIAKAKGLSELLELNLATGGELATLHE